MEDDALLNEDEEAMAEAQNAWQVRKALAMLVD